MKFFTRLTTEYKQCRNWLYQSGPSGAPGARYEQVDIENYFLEEMERPADALPAVSETLQEAQGDIAITAAGIMTEVGSAAYSPDMFQYGGTVPTVPVIMPETFDSNHVLDMSEFTGGEQDLGKAFRFADGSTGVYERIPDSNGVMCYTFTVEAELSAGSDAPLQSPYICTDAHTCQRVEVPAPAVVVTPEPIPEPTYQTIETTPLAPAPAPVIEETPVYVAPSVPSYQPQVVETNYTPSASMYVPPAPTKAPVVETVEYGVSHNPCKEFTDLNMEVTGEGFTDDGVERVLGAKPNGTEGVDFLPYTVHIPGLGEKEIYLVPTVEVRSALHEVRRANQDPEATLLLGATETGASQYVADSKAIDHNTVYDGMSLFEGIGTMMKSIVDSDTRKELSHYREFSLGFEMESADGTKCVHYKIPRISSIIPPNIMYRGGDGEPKGGDDSPGTKNETNTGAESVTSSESSFG